MVPGRLPSRLPRRTLRVTTPALVISTLLIALIPAHAAAQQYFGGNKVQYRTFTFEVLRTEHFDVYFYEEEREAAAIAARMAERWRARLGRALSHDLTGRQPLILYAAHPHFEQTNAIGGEIGEGTGGVTESLRRRIILPLGGPLADTDHVIGHELVHAFQFDITTPRDGGGRGAVPGAQRLPLWFVEGMAEYLSIGPIDAHTALWVRDAVLQEKLPRIKDLDDPDYFPYRWGQAFWAYVAGRWGDEMVGRLLRDAARAGSPDMAIETNLGMKTEQLSDEWQAALRRLAEQVPKDTAPAGTIANLLTKPRGLGGELNVSPALSPDGSQVAFLSERGLFSIDLYIANAETGDVIESVSRTAIDPHFSSLQFISSAGGWSPAGDRFAFAVITAGRPALAIYDVGARRVDHEISLPGVDEAFNPTWSPDGTRIAFSGLTGGLTDLFVVDVASGAVNRLTTDPYADIQPSWSPDGERIAFTTDRFTTKLDTLDIGAYEVALINPATRQIEPVAGFANAKNMNPQWAADGRTIYFLSDRGGITNVYRVTPGAGDLRQSTNVQTGITGITATSPALSVAQRAGRMAFSVYEGGQHRVYATTRAEVLAGLPPQDLPAVSAALLPPATRRDGRFVALLENPVPGLPAQVPAETEPYKARLQLDAVGQPSFGIGRDRFGAFGSGGIAFQLSDTLGDHTLGAAVDFTTSISGETSYKDLGGSIAYTNLKRRWNWGVYAEQVPYRTGGFGAAFTEINGEPAYIEQTVLYRQTVQSVGGVVAYPFSRAQRVEFSSTLRRLSFDQETRTIGYSNVTGALLLDERDSQSIIAPMGFGEAAAALVYDTSVFGATSPVLGQRYRLEVAPVAGSVNFTNLLADYRRYFMPVQFFTIATRVMHYGRYGSDSEDPRLTPLFIGYPTLVRGYDIDSFTAEECRFDPSGGCPAFERLIGSRTLVGNVELRMPLLRPFGVRQGLYGPLPVELAFFADGGVAWDQGSKPDFFGGDRKPVASAGVALRINAFGYAVVQLDYSRPFQREDRGWIFQFSLAPGF
jgi:Tol biopolymer transport system component